MQTCRQRDRQTDGQTDRQSDDNPRRNSDVTVVQQLQCAADVCGGASSERRIWSGNSLYSSASVSSASACLATAWNACSTFSASLALVSKYGRFPLLVHHCCARFGITWNTIDTINHHNRFTALIPGPPGWAGARREILDFMVQGKINWGRHTDHPAGCHSIRTNQCPPPPSPIFFYRPDALPAAQPTVSMHWRQLSHSINQQLFAVKNKNSWRDEIGNVNFFTITLYM